VSDHLDRWVSTTIRNEIEQRFYAKVNDQANFNRLVRDPQFMAAPNEHVGLFSDPGVVHARDIASQILTVLANCHGVLIPRRSSQRFAFMQGCGVLLAYFHDIGMSDFSVFGRSMHPEFAAQAVFDPALDDLIAAIWSENSGGLAWRLRTLADEGLIPQEPQMMLREILSLSICHSKSKIPVALLNDPIHLRDKMIEVLTTDLSWLYAQQQLNGHAQELETSGQKAERQPNPKIGRFSHLFPDQAFLWLIDDHPVLKSLAEDVTDTLRALRAADALRQRGSAQVTSGGYPVFVDRTTGSNVYALRLEENQLYLLAAPNIIGAGEANIASSELEPSGDLRISFHRGSFSAPGATEKAAHTAAFVLYDIQRDIIRSFIRTANDPALRPASDLLILLEETDDNPSFAQQVQTELRLLDPEVANRVRLTPSLMNADPLERDRYLAAEPLNWGLQTRRELLARVGQSGFPVERIDIQQAFKDVRLAELDVGEVLLEAGAPSSFVYLPLGPGLKIIPLGGYRSLSAQPWILQGIIGVIRGAERSATIVIECRLQVLIIPKTTYLTYWYQTLSVVEFQTAIANSLGDSSAQTGSISQLEKSMLLQAVPLFKSLEQQVLLELASRVSEAHIAAGEILFSKGSLGRTLFVVVEGSLRVHDQALELAQLGPGDVIGEIAAVTPEPRTATVTAIEKSSLLCLDQRDLDDLLDSHTGVARSIIQALAGYTRERAS
jgi:hypothetical protein